MSFKAEFKTSGKTYDVLECNYGFERDVDSKGKPQSIIKGGTVELKVEMAGSDTTLLETMVNDPFKPHNGEVTFYQSDSNQVAKTLKYSNGYIISYKEDFSNSSGDAQAIAFTVSAEKIDIGNAKHTNEWPKK
jgi:hypothetical protein